MPEGVFTRGGDTKLQEQLGFSPKTPFDGSQCSEFLLEKGPGSRQRKSAPLPNSAHAASQCRPYRSRSTGMVCRRSPQALRLGMEHASSKKAVWYAESFHRDDQDFNFNSVRDLADFLTTRHFSGRCIASARNISATSVTLSSTFSLFRHLMCVRHSTCWSTPIARRRSLSTSRACLDCSSGKSPRSWRVEHFL